MPRACHTEYIDLCVDSSSRFKSTDIHVQSTDTQTQLNALPMTRPPKVWITTVSDRSDADCPGMQPVSSHVAPLSVTKVKFY